MSIDAAIDQAVARLSHSGAGPRPIVGAPWLDGVERRLGFSLPPSYRSLVERYAFPVLDVGSAELFANEGDESEYDITVALFRDPHMSPWLAARRLLHIGHPYIGDYDPICLDVGKRPFEEPTVVQLNHEDILLERATVRRSVVAPSFLALITSGRDA